MNDEWWWMMNDEWWMMNDEWWMMNDGWWMMNDEWWMMNDIALNRNQFIHSVVNLFAFGSRWGSSFFLSQNAKSLFRTTPASKNSGSALRAASQVAGASQPRKTSKIGRKSTWNRRKSRLWRSREPFSIDLCCSRYRNFWNIRNFRIIRKLRRSGISGISGMSDPPGSSRG